MRQQRLSPALMHESQTKGRQVNFQLKHSPLAFTRGSALPLFELGYFYLDISVEWYIDLQLKLCAYFIPHF